MVENREMDRVRLGFIPLVDAAIPVVAREMGFAERAGIDLRLSREASWAAVRDKVVYGALDCAHMLAGMPIAASLGIGQLRDEMIAPMSLGLGGNAITVSCDLHAAMMDADPEAMAGPRAGSARALAKVIATRAAVGADPLIFGVVFPVSSHNYEIRCWMASAGIDPDEDVELVVISPQRMVENLESGRIAGFCVGEPWNQVAVDLGLGHVVATKPDLWPAAPEKVLGMRAEWAAAHGGVLKRLLVAMVEAARWADDPRNHGALAGLLSREDYVGAPAELIGNVLNGRPRLSPKGQAVEIPGYHVFHRYAATFPWVSQAEWVIGQMRRWGQLNRRVDTGAVAGRVFRPDLYREALAGSAEKVPANDFKLEGGHAETYSVPGVGGVAISMAPDRWAVGVG